MSSRKKPPNPGAAPDASRESPPADHLRQEVEALDAVLNLPQPARRRSGARTGRKPPGRTGKDE